MPLFLLLLALIPTWREALPNYRYEFPRDHFAHPDYKTEWWYYTGNVWSENGQRFGFELVFFRQGDRRSARDNPSVWRIDDLYLAHAALTDVAGRRFASRERLNRAGPGLAGADLAQRRVWNGNWSVQWEHERQQLSAWDTDFAFDLTADPIKPVVIHGENGVSQKSAGAGDASHYISFPRLRVRGSLRWQGTNLPVSGQAWMDHEWFSHVMSAEQSGWDWFSIQLDDGTELMLYQLRRKDDRRDPFSSGTFIPKDGRARHLTASEFSLEPIEWWTSARTKARYPVKWKLAIPSLFLQLECRALVPSQELVAEKAGPSYWEGAVDFSGTVHGVGYLEMTGYDRPFALN